MVARDLDRGVESGCRGVELALLLLDALAHRAGPDTRRVQRLYTTQHRLNLCGVAFNLGPEGVGDLLQRLGQVAVVADGINNSACNRKLTRFELGQLELPEQVILERLAGGIG